MNKKEKDFYENDDQPNDNDIKDFYPSDQVKEDDRSAESTEKDHSNLSDDYQDDTVVFTPVKPSKEKQGKLSLKQILIVTAVFIIYTVVLLTASWLIFYRPDIGSKGTPFDTTPGQLDKPKSSDTVKDDEDNTGKSDDDYVESGYQYNILLVGRDKLAYLADVTMLINCDTKNNTVTVMQIPRDTYVSSDVYSGKINAVFPTLMTAARAKGSSDPYTDAMNEYASLLEKNLCINIHHIALVDLQGFRNIVNALGGVDVYVPNSMYYSDPEQGLYIDISAGMQHLDGETAEGFVRFRSGYVQADLGRVNAQKIFLTAFFNKLKDTIKSVDVSTLNSLFTEVQKNVTTDLSLSDMLYYAKVALKIDLDKVTMLTVPGHVSGMYYVINRTATLDAVNKYFNVYNKEISDAIFDRNSAFCDQTNEYMCAVYNDDPANVLDGEYTASTINDDSILIPRTQSWTPVSDDLPPQEDTIDPENGEITPEDDPVEESEEFPFDINEDETEEGENTDAQSVIADTDLSSDEFADAGDESEPNYIDEYTEEQNG